MRVAITTMGCKVNQYDTAVMQRLFSEKDWKEVSFTEAADAYVVNSCTVTDRADSEARRLCRRARRTNPGARVIMTGCYAQVGSEAISQLDYVDHVIGLGRLPELLKAVEGELSERAVVADVRRATEVETLGIATFSGRTRAFVKVQEGCDLFCTFCIVPVARGTSRSVPIRTVIEEIEALANAGYREVVLTGVHLGGYGADLEKGTDLAFLLECIAERQPKLRVRISSVDPPELTARFIGVTANSEVFCPHFHIPTQAGSDSVLDRMRRLYTADEAAASLDRLRAAIPGVCIGTDVITGFPGETEQEFQEGLRWIEEREFAYLHVFPYSKRTSTSAAKRWEPLESAIVHDRARQMRELDARLRRRYQDAFIGQEVHALFENVRDSTTGLLKGYSEQYLPLSCDGGDELAGEITKVVVQGRTGDRLNVIPR